MYNIVSSVPFISFTFFFDDNYMTMKLLDTYLYLGIQIFSRSLS